MKIIKPTKPVLPKYEDYIEEIKSIWETGSMTNNGPKLQKLRQILIEYTDCPNCELFVSGHWALVTALKAMKLSGEVLTSPFTFVSTTNAIAQAGLTPVFCDIDETYQLDPLKLEQHITEKTCAIVTPHIFGIPCDVDGIQEIADRHGLKVIYDAAQAFGTMVHGKHIGAYGDATMFSFHAIKVYNSIEGGMLAYSDESLRESLELYRNFGINHAHDDEVEVCGYNAKMDEFRAAMGLVNLRRLEEEIARRHELAQHYADVLADIPGVSAYAYREDIRYNHAYYPVLIEEREAGISRDELCEALKKRGVQTRKLYARLTCDNPIFSEYKRDTEYADLVKEKALDLPIYGDLNIEDIDYIGASIKELAIGSSI